jgi:hypothetical protein
MKTDLKNLYVTLSLLGLCIVAYFFEMKHVYKDKVAHNDPLNVKIIDVPGQNCCSWWPISHFVSFLVWALIWPQYWKHLFALGILWEILEDVGKYITTKKIPQFVNMRNSKKEGSKVEYEDWWSSSSKDIVFNAAGIAAGVAIRSLT